MKHIFLFSKTLDFTMIELITGVVGFVAGIGITAAFLRRRKSEHWGKGYIKVGQDMFPKRDDTSSKPLYPVLQVPEQTQTSEQQQQNKEEPKIPSWW